MSKSSDVPAILLGDRELLVRIDERVSSIDTRVEKLEKAINGNGRPGIITRLAKVEARLVIISTIVLGAIGYGASAVI